MNDEWWKIGEDMPMVSLRICSRCNNTFKAKETSEGWPTKCPTCTHRLKRLKYLRELKGDN